MRVTESHSRRKTLGLLLASALTLAGFAPPAQAAKGGKGNGKEGNNGGGSNGRSNGGGKGGGNAGGGKGKGSQGGGSRKSGGSTVGGVEVTHRNGMLERILRGRYEMKDNRGRTIVNRPATAADRRRLADLASHSRW